MRKPRNTVYECSACEQCFDDLESFLDHPCVEAGD